MLGVLLGDIPGRQDIAQKLLPSLLQHSRDAGYPSGLDDMFEDRIIRLFFYFLNKDPTGEDHVRSRNLALLIHTIDDHLFREGKSFTASQFGLLMDYHLHICQGTDYDLINATFRMLRIGPTSNPERMRCYIDTIIRFMGEKTTSISALRAAWAIRVEIASMTRDDESLHEDFSKALASVLLLYPRQTTLRDNPFKEPSFFDWSRDEPYLRLLCTLAQGSAWHLQLYQDGHIDNCLAIAQTLLSQFDNCYAAPVAHIFAIIDASGDKTHPFYNTVQAYPRRHLVLHAWDYIFDKYFLRMLTEDNWRTNLHEGYLNSLPSLIVYARKESNGNDEPLFALVEEFCRKIEERKQHEQGDAQQGHDWSLWYKEISGLWNQIQALLDASLEDT